MVNLSSLDQRSHGLRWRGAALLILLSCGSLLTSAIAGAVDLSRRVQFNIPAQPLSTALLRFSEQAAVQFAAPSKLLRDLQTDGIRGELPMNDALQTLLRGTGLTFEALDERTVAIRKAAFQTRSPSAARESIVRGKGGEQGGGTNGNGTLGKPEMAQSDSSPRSDPEPEKRPDSLLGEIVVTGTHIRGATSAGSSIYVIDREDIEAGGFATVEAVVRSLPQNFNGGPSEDTRLGQEATFNASRATGINLRGLGAGSTLVLVNGRRLAPAGSDGRFSDVSGIPLSAIERVEVLADGASAIYGSDAVGGVVNFILRKDYAGSETQLRYGSVTGGGTNESQIAQLFGGQWESGSGLLSLEYYKRDALAASERWQTASSDLTPYGGDNFDSLDGNPGTILAGLDIYAIPRGQDGRSLTPGDFVAGTFNLHNSNEANEVLPEQERWSIVATGRQDLGSRAHLFADLLFTHRDTLSVTPGLTGFLTVPRTNAFYVNPAGGTDPINILYSFTDDLGPVRSPLEVNVSSLTLGSASEIGEAWGVAGYVGYAREKQDTTSAPFVNQAALEAALADSNPLTAFNPFGDGSFTNPTTLTGITEDAGVKRTVDLRTANVAFDGTLFSWSGREAKVAFGADYRKQSLDSISRQGSIVDVNRTLDREVTAAFAELAIPLVDKRNARPGLMRLDLSIAGRYENYSDSGTATTPKYGVVWSPVGGFSLRGTYSESFKAPNLVDLDESINGSSIFPIDDASSPTGLTDTLFWFGGNADLQEETAIARTLGADFSPATLPLSIAITYFDIEFKGRVEAVDFVATFLNEPQLASFVTRNPSAAQREEVCSRGTFLGEPNDCRNAPVGALIDMRSSNIAVTETSGFDLIGSYQIDSRVGRFGFDLNATYLRSFSQAPLPTSPLVELLNTQSNPIDLRLRGSLSWSHRGLTVSAFMNYTDGYKDIASDPERKIGDWFTVDANVSYEMEARDQSWLDGTFLSLNIQNVFDEDPPFVNNPAGVGYDRENADILGRFLSVSLRKQW